MLGFLAQTTNYYSGSEVDSGGALAALGGIWLLSLVLWAVSVVALWKIFEKAGIPGWKAIIPIYNSWLLFEMAGKPGWWALVPMASIVPLLAFVVIPVYIVLYVIAALELGKAFGKSTAFSVVGLVIFNLVGLLILGYGKDKYTKPSTAPAHFS